MGRISAYQSTDGRIFQDRAVYKAHQAWLDLKELMRACDVLDEKQSVLAAGWLTERADDFVRLIRAAKEAP